jgi:hypothetical protein
LFNANGLTEHAEELKTFISFHNIDVMLTEKSYLKLLKYCTNPTNHPVGTTRGGTVVIIKKYIKHHQLNNYSQDLLQATSVRVEDTVGLQSI